MRRIDVGPRRGGFTLLEMLVVLTIILALMALSASAVIKVMAVQMNNNTQTTLNKLQSALNKQWSAAKEQAKTEAIPASVLTYIQANLAGTDANAATRTRVIYIKLRMRQLFPMNFNEALNPAPLPPLPAYQKYLFEYGITVASPATAYLESSVCLMMALSRAQSGGPGNSADLGGGGSTVAFALPNGHSIPVFADAWGQPIYFSRVPAGYAPIGNTVPYPGVGTPGINDPGDPLGLLNALTWRNSLCAPLFSSLTLQPLPALNCSYRLLPMLASGGPDKQISDPIWFSPTQAMDNDNMYSNP